MKNYLLKMTHSPEITKIYTLPETFAEIFAWETESHYPWEEKGNVLEKINV